MSVLAVDLGTSNTVAVLSAHDRPPRVVEVEGSATMPSAVFAGDDGRLVVGREAERRARLNPARFEPNPKRRVDEGTLLLGDRVVPVSEAFAAVLGKVAEETSRQLGGARADEVRLTHPAQWGPVRRNVLLSAARQAGLGSNLVLIPEPVAAAAHFASFPGRTLVPGQALAVYDLGAGTFDVAIVGVTQTGFTVLAEAGLPDLGGLDVDQALLQHVGSQVSHLDPHAWQRLMMPQSTADRRSQRALREDVRAAKEALSGHPQTDMPLPEPFHDVLITRAELESLIRPNLIRSAELLAATIRQAGLSPDRLAGVYLVGGSSRIPLVATLISEQLRIVATNLDQPETAVALGVHHVPRGSTSLRTGTLAGLKPSESAVRPHTPSSTAQPPQQVPSVSPVQRQMQPAGGLHGVPGSRHGATKWWMTGVAAFVAIAVVVALAASGVFGGGRSVNQQSTPRTQTETENAAGKVSTTEDDLPSFILDQSKEIDPSVVDSFDCATLFSLEGVGAASGFTATLASSEGRGCVYSLNDTSGEQIEAAGVSFSESYGDIDDDMTEMDLVSNSTFYEKIGDFQCIVKVALRKFDGEHGSAVLLLAVNAQGEASDPCAIAGAVARYGFDSIPDA